MPSEQHQDCETNIFHFIKQANLNATQETRPVKLEGRHSMILRQVKQLDEKNETRSTSLIVAD